MQEIAPPAPPGFRRLADALYVRGGMIPLTRPQMGDEETEAASRVLKSGQLVQGPEVARFEQELAERCGRRHGIAVSSGTSALQLSLQALGIGPGDEVLVPDLTWPSPAHAVVACGARPVLVDVDPEEWNVTARALSEARTGHTRAAIAIDQFGNPVRRDEIEAALPDLPLIEDAACAIGSRFDARPCGSMGEIACFSFHPRKVLTTGEGGMCVTDRDDVAEQLRTLRNHGQSAPGQFRQPSLNHRMGEVAAAVGRVQLGRLDSMLEQRQRLATRYREALAGRTLQQVPEGSMSNHQTMGLLLPEAVTLEQRDATLDALRRAGVQAGVLSHALHQLPSLQRAARHASGEGRAFPSAEAIVRRGIALPLYDGMTQAEQDTVLDAMRQVLP